jgi:hypothetical protein
MTDAEKKAERVKALASAVYREMHHARRSENYVRTIAVKHGEHPAFQEFMREMCLTDALEEFLSRPTLRSA